MENIPNPYVSKAHPLNPGTDNLGALSVNNYVFVLLTREEGIPCKLKKDCLISLMCNYDLQIARRPPQFRSPLPLKTPLVFAIKEACQLAVGVKCPPKLHEIPLKVDWRRSDR